MVAGREVGREKTENEETTARQLHRVNIVLLRASNGVKRVLGYARSLGQSA